jgi:DNA-binding response OmpR family regulator
MAQHVLIVEDDPKIAELVAKNLEAAGLVCHWAKDGSSALGGLHKSEPQLVVLDLMIPGIDGFEVARRIRAESDVPILMLTARSTESDKVLGFEIGADDYLTKPFSTRELVARVRALLRRASPRSEEDSVLHHGALALDAARRVVEVGGRLVDLTTLEFDLLYFLAQRPGRVFGREQLLQQVWGEDRYVDDRSIDSLVSRLRRKIEADPSHPRYVQTVWGAGYRFSERSDG